jgi:hypothetical protein
VSRARRRLAHLIKVSAAENTEERDKQLAKSVDAPTAPPKRQPKKKPPQVKVLVANGDASLTAFRKVSTPSLPTPGDLVLGIAGLHPDYAKFLARADPRLSAILSKLKEKAKRGRR